MSRVPQPRRRRGLRWRTDVVVVHGSNGAGKTNLLEAVYFGLTGRSFRAGNDRDMIRFGEQGARVELEPERERFQPAVGHRPLRGAPSPDRRQAALRRARGAPAGERLPPGSARSSSRAHRPTAGRISTVSAARSGRREPTCAAASGARSRSGTPWSQRIRAGPGRGRVAALLGRATRRRGGAPDGGEGRGGRRARRDRSPSWRAVSACPRPRSPIGHGRPAAASELAAELGSPPRRGPGPRLHLLRARSSTRSSCASAAGPLRRFGSQGQQRLALLALLFAERAALIEAGRSAPLMLLDDVMSELDPAHRGLLVSLLEGSGGQARDHGDGVGARPVGERALRIEVGERSRQRRARPEGGVSGRRAPRPIAAAHRRGSSSAPSPRPCSRRCRAPGRGRWGRRSRARRRPVSERDGVVTVACRSSTWAQELDLLSGQITRRSGKICPIRDASGGPSLHHFGRSRLIPSFVRHLQGFCDGPAQFPVLSAGRLMCTCVRPRPSCPQGLSEPGHEGRGVP